MQLGPFPVFTIFPLLSAGASITAIGFTFGDIKSQTFTPFCVAAATHWSFGLKEI